jgi:ketosteroid isomerase-like protein
MKKLFMILPLVILLCFTLSCQKAEEVAEEPAVDIAAEEAAIKETMKKSFEGLNKHDIEIHLSTLIEDYETWSGKPGLEDRENRLTEVWRQQKDVQYNVLEEISINFISPHVAIYRARAEITGGVKEDGTPMPRDELQGAWILTKKNGKWLIAAWFTRPIEE